MAVRLSVARRRLGAYIERVNADGVAVRIETKRGSAVLIAQSEYEELVDLFFLATSPLKAGRLAAIHRHESEGKPDSMHHPNPRDPAAQSTTEDRRDHLEHTSADGAPLESHQTDRKQKVAATAKRIAATSAELNRRLAAGPPPN